MYELFALRGIHDRSGKGQEVVRNRRIALPDAAAIPMSPFPASLVSG